MIPPFFVSVLSAAASHDQPETTTRTDSEAWIASDTVHHLQEVR